MNPKSSRAFLNIVLSSILIVALFSGCLGGGPPAGNTTKPSDYVIRIADSDKVFQIHAAKTKNYFLRVYEYNPEGSWVQLDGISMAVEEGVSSILLVLNGNEPGSALMAVSGASLPMSMTIDGRESLSVSVPINSDEQAVRFCSLAQKEEDISLDELEGETALVYRFAYGDNNNNVPEQFDSNWWRNPEAFTDKDLQILVCTITPVDN